MANVTTVTRSNYFRCQDPDTVRRVLSACKTDGNPVVTAQEGDRVMFYCEGEIEGMMTPEAAEKIRHEPQWAEDHPDEAWSMEQLCKYLMAHVAPDDACCIMSIGREAMREIWGDCYIMTRTAMRIVNMRQMVESAVKNELRDPRWEFRF